MTMSICVVIVTKNRSADLKDCLMSLMRQTVFPKKLIVIDNCSTDNTRATIRSFSRVAPFPIKIITEGKKGYPAIYNRGLQEATGKWVAFIDDDCVAKKNWVKEIHRATDTFPHAAAILGLSETLYPHNAYAFATFALNYIWKENGSQREKIYKGEILDNKNIVYNRLFLTAHSLRFDEERTAHFHGASEDCDLGYRIVKAGGRCFYLKSIQVKHKDPTTHRHFIGKLARAFSAYVHYRSNSQDEISPASNPPKMRLRRILFSEMRKHNLSLIEQGLVVIAIAQALLVQRYVLAIKRYKSVRNPFPAIH